LGSEIRPNIRGEEKMETIDFVQNWKEILNERMDNYNNEVSEITSAFKNTLSELKRSPFNLYKAEVELVDNRKNLTWVVTIGDHEKIFYIHDFKAKEWMNNGKAVETLEEKVILAILDKFDFKAE
jgi:hypothetical protein